MKQIPLTQGKFATVDDDTYNVLSKVKWYVVRAKNNRWYVVRRDSGKTIYMHRIIMATPDGLDVDHINHNGLDNCRANLRNCTRSQNMANTKSETGSSKYKGVTWDARERKWTAQIGLHYKIYHLGYFKDETKAAEVYNKKAKELFGEFAYVNIFKE